MSDPATRIMAVLLAETAKRMPEPGMTPMEAIIGRRMADEERDVAERCLMEELQPFLGKPTTPENEAELIRTILKFTNDWTRLQ